MLLWGELGQESVKRAVNALFPPDSKHVGTSSNGIPLNHLNKPDT